MKENKMGTMPVSKLLLTMSGPAILSMLIQACYNIVDTIFVSRVCEEALSAVTYIFPIQMLMIAFGVGTGIGVNSLIARRLGARRFDEANSAASHGFRLSFFNWLLFTVIGVFFAGPFMRLFTETPYILENGTAYLKVVTIGCLFIMVQMMTEKILQSTGNMVLPMLCSFTGATLNVFLDAVLIFGLFGLPAMGVLGAAVATVVSQFLSMCLGLFLLFGKTHYVKVTIRNFKYDREILKDIYAVALPAILMQAISSVMQIGMNWILSGISETAIAVSGVYGRVQSFVFMPVIGINQGSLPVLGYNYGAGNKKRFMKAYRFALAMAISVMFAGLIVFMTFPGPILSIFNASGTMLSMGIPAFRIISICFPFAAFGILTSATFQATGHGTWSLWMSLIRQLIGILPLAYIFSIFAGLNMIWASFPLAEILGVSYAILKFRKLYLGDISKLVPVADRGKTDLFENM